MKVHRRARHVVAIALTCGALATSGCGPGSTASPVPPGSGAPGSGAPGSGAPGSGATPTPGPTGSGTPTARPSATPTPPPTATPTAVPTATPSPTPAPTSVPNACGASPATIGASEYGVIATGTVPAGGGPFAQASGNWTKELFSAAGPTPTPGPTAPPTATPTPGPIPTPPPTRPFYVYQGTYQIASATAPTTGCFSIITTTDGSNFNGLPVSALATGSPNPPATSYSVSITGVGSVTTINLALSPSAPNSSGTMSLDNGDSGTITITSVSTVQLPLSRIRKSF